MRRQSSYLKMIYAGFLLFALVKSSAFASAGAGVPSPLCQLAMTRAGEGHNSNPSFVRGAIEAGNPEQLEFLINNAKLAVNESDLLFATLYNFKQAEDSRRTWYQRPLLWTASKVRNWRDVRAERDAGWVRDRIVQILAAQNLDVSEESAYGLTPLFTFIQYNDTGHSAVVGVKALVEKGADINFRNAENGFQSPLALAIDQKDFETADYLLDQSQLILDQPDTVGTLPVFLKALAVRAPRALIEKLVARGSDVTAEKREINGLTQVIRDLDVETARFLIESLKVPIRHSDLVAAAQIAFAQFKNGKARWLELLTLLLDGGANPNFIPVTPTGALQGALLVRPSKKISVAEAVKLLLDRGADPNQVSNYGQTPLSIALATQDFESAALLLDHPSINPNAGDLCYAREVFLVAAEADAPIAILKKLIARGARTNIQVKRQTPLTRSIESGDSGRVIEMVDQLKIRIVEADMWLATQQTSRKSYAVLHALLERGGDANVSDPDGSNLLSRVLSTLSESTYARMMAEDLIAHGAKTTPSMDAMLKRAK